MIDAATQAADTWAHIINLERQYAVMYGDGEVVEANDRDDAEDQIVAARGLIEDGSWDADDYEPMKLVTRVEMVALSPWVTAPDGAK